MILHILTHADKRAAQRGISTEMIKTAIQYGEVFFRQGLRYFISRERNLYGIIPDSLIEQYRNTVVILNSRNEIVTCYKNKKAITHIRKKCKWLYVDNRF